MSCAGVGAEAKTALVTKPNKSAASRLTDKFSLHIFLPFLLYNIRKIFTNKLFSYVTKNKTFKRYMALL